MDGHLGYFHFLAIIKKCCCERLCAGCVNTRFQFSRAYIQAWNSWVYDSSVFNHFRNCQPVFQSGCSVLKSFAAAGDSGFDFCAAPRARGDVCPGLPPPSGCEEISQRGAGSAFPSWPRMLTCFLCSLASGLSVLEECPFKPLPLFKLGCSVVPGQSVYRGETEGRGDVTEPRAWALQAG